MKRFPLLLMLVLLATLNFAAQENSAQKIPNQNPETVKFVTSDINLFWKAYDLAKPENNINVFRDEYLRKGSAGLQEFRKLRIGSACGLVDAIESAPKYYAALREPSLKIASYENTMRANFRRLKEIYPAAVFPDVYFLIGRMNSGGTLNDQGLFIGVDVYGKNGNAPLDELDSWHQAVIAPTARIPFIVAHESIHYQQDFAVKESDWTLLDKALAEGGADFIGELIAGGIINPQLHAYGNPREKELWLEFKKEMNGKDISNWMYQGDNVKDKPADLGYYIGYKICESYYKNATDKKQAVADILKIQNSNDFLKASRHEEKFRSE